MKKNKGVLILILAVCSVIVSLYFDSSLIKEASLLRNGILDWFFLLITYVSSEVIIFFILTALFLSRDKKREWIIPLWLSLFLSALVSFVLKITVQRARPFQLGIVSLLPSLLENSYSIWNFSFPSFQSMLAFCAIPILSKQYPKLKKFWIAFAVLIAFSRVYFGLHFFSDVIAGGIIGYLIGMLIVRLEKEHKFGKKIYNRIMRR